MKPIQVLAVTGGKGGVGKTNVSVNLSLALAAAGKRVILMDADLGLANVDIQLGLKADKTLAQVLNGECLLRDILLTTPGGVKVIPAASGVQSLTYEAYEERAEAKLAEIVDEIRVRWPATGAVVLLHRTGLLVVGESSVVVVVSSPHRPEAFEAGRYAITNPSASDTAIKAEVTSNAPSGVTPTVTISSTTAGIITYKTITATGSVALASKLFPFVSLGVTSRTRVPVM